MDHRRVLCLPNAIVTSDAPIGVDKFKEERYAFFFAFNSWGRSMEASTASSAPLNIFLSE